MPRILHVADIHARQPWMDWIMGHAPGFDLLCIAGDLQDAFAPAGMHAQAKALRPWLLQLPIPTIVCTGNHDWWPEDERARDVYAEGGWIRMLAGKGRIVAVDGYVGNIEPLSLAVVGWNQPPVWRAGTDIVVCHSPPAGVIGPDSEEHGSREAEIRSAILVNPPRLYLCGHIHWPRQRWCRLPGGPRQTLALNPGCDLEAGEPSRWDIDTDAERAIWRGPSAETIEVPLT